MYDKTKAHTNMGYKHGNSAVSMSYMKKKYHKMMLAAILILTAVIFCYQVAYGDTGDCANQNQPTLVGCPLDYVKSVEGFPPLFGKWTYVNYTATAFGGRYL